MNVQALKRGDTLLLIVAAHPSTPVTNKKRDELRWPTKLLKGTPYWLTAEERAWVDAYHARVLDELAPLADGAAGWLEEACSPL